VLVECGFLTNATEAQYVQNVNYRQKLAEEIAAGIRGRSQVTSSRVAVAGAVPLQPFIDQTRVRDPDLSRHKRSKKSSKSKSRKHRISSDTEAEKKTPSKKKKTSSDDTSSKKKKSSAKKSED
jgi:N-acetylmuramoyl-L-alanine amidase